MDGKRFLENMSWLWVYYDEKKTGAHQKWQSENSAQCIQQKAYLRQFK